jgi:probable rRNA maturation factor
VANGEVALILTESDELHRLNRRFRRKDRPTDVLAFDYAEDGTAPATPDAVPHRSIYGDVSDRADAVPHRSIYGDVYVSADAANRQAQERAIAPTEEAARLFLHGCLHLMGYRHDTPAALGRMLSLQEKLLADLLR